MSNKKKIGGHFYYPNSLANDEFGDLKYLARVCSSFKPLRTNCGKYNNLYSKLSKLKKSNAEILMHNEIYLRERIEKIKYPGKKSKRKI